MATSSMHGLARALSGTVMPEFGLIIHWTNLRIEVVGRPTDVFHRNTANTGMNNYEWTAPENGQAVQVLVNRPGWRRTPGSA